MSTFRQMIRSALRPAAITAAFLAGCIFLGCGEYANMLMAIAVIYLTVDSSLSPSSNDGQ